MHFQHLKAILNNLQQVTTGTGSGRGGAPWHVHLHEDAMSLKFWSQFKPNQPEHIGFEEVIK